MHSSTHPDQKTPSPLRKGEKEPGTESLLQACLTSASLNYRSTMGMGERTQSAGELHHGLFFGLDLTLPIASSSRLQSLIHYSSER